MLIGSHYIRERWRTLKSVVVWAEGEGGELGVRTVIGMKVGERWYILFEGKLNIASSVS